jgi:hypothetical protein
MFGFIDADEGPSAFWDLPHDERTRRLRAYLLAVASGADPLLVWMLALDFTEPVVADVHDLVDAENCDDARLVGLVERGAHPAERIVRLTSDRWRPG